MSLEVNLNPFDCSLEVSIDGKTFHPVEFGSLDLLKPSKPREGLKATFTVKFVEGMSAAALIAAARCAGLARRRRVRDTPKRRHMREALALKHSGRNVPHPRRLKRLMREKGAW
jgi:hypothetical protein